MYLIQVPQFQTGLAYSVQLKQEVKNTVHWQTTLYSLYLVSLTFNEGCRMMWGICLLSKSKLRDVLQQYNQCESHQTADIKATMNHKILSMEQYFLKLPSAHL